jgi:ABC-type branched-subunit amino acid transport system permease subunit|tara:strand:- start:1504 stop:1683 length:180 start_codon:yes stop_codon:yes gene_type:complete
MGAAVFAFLYFSLSKFAGISLLIQGIILTDIMLLMPQGIIGTMRETKIYQQFVKKAIFQ